MKLRNLLLGGLAALALSGCNDKVEGTVIWEGKTEDGVVAYKVQDLKHENEVTCVTLKQEGFKPFKEGDVVKLRLNYISLGNPSSKLPGEYVDGEFQQTRCYDVEKYQIVKLEKEE